ncbi:MAG: 4Fe-4S cluster-binding domain-containing protein [Sphingobacteriia bacterium]|nr:4Fe-4S cluster-binding domain-containing protein [Sphingobacteriia bacterium]
MNCNLCPHECNAMREQTSFGFCRSHWLPGIASICIHKGEEPVISGEKGIVNVFFTHCNLQCTYCQNRQISNNKISDELSLISIENAVDEIIKLLTPDISLIGFVSPSHHIDAMEKIVYGLHQKGFYPRVVYNSNGYDKISTLKRIENIVDIYLPDYKYADSDLGFELSKVIEYPLIALKALKEMYRQKGSALITDDNGYAISGMIIRHLVLPGYLDNTMQILENIAWEISTGVHLSLMSQYNPQFYHGSNPNLLRKVSQEEYDSAIAFKESLGIYKGWTQELVSNDFYNPDFTLDHPFESSST